jgi:hypothetical protein
MLSCSCSDLSKGLFTCLEPGKVRLIVLKVSFVIEPEMHYYCYYYSLTQPLLAMHRYLYSPRTRPRQARPYALDHCTGDLPDCSPSDVEDSHGGMAE